MVLIHLNLIVFHFLFYDFLHPFDKTYFCFLLQILFFFVLNNLKRITCNTQFIYNYKMTYNYYWKENEKEVDYMIEHSEGIAKKILIETKNNAFA